ncbi:LivM family inner-membrane translocator [Azotobacter vinelandii CA]|uniref:Bacterial inner-membrane translocator, LivM family n=2 Tax=Azotobacter vinelandii TaxID=354 RepID=C1DGK1_AZOVD|nr:branched-chain amino acid ABC transporter permease [Azotobacter vinelandii]ACO80497.1 Bacterial inner-membrane translocator, LivM family [Azotobacter vinelandii DJ]AGK15973.1 LivM family inner-membrane translocator [Azotobacter vinelandii CA]AGK21954.1 LivM family inner-membrane translocator [Azotobacter vinelandii CA6]SFX35647.1 amino acid/amide ABC transporter membrane protein 2, HAAT family [Azotobacter vinelandii]GLK58543.1 branched-chain amino acid ABC transporter permease [Azotobacter
MTTTHLPASHDGAPLELQERRAPWPLAILLAVAFVLVPWLGDDYWLNAILIPFLVLSLAGLGLNLLTGYTGQTSVGAAGFMAVGAFASYGLLLRVPGLPLPLALAGGGAIAAAVGLVFGIPSNRIKGFYLMVTTLAAQFFLEWVFTKFPWFYNHASSGTISAPRLELFGLDLHAPAGRYLLVLGCVTLLTWVAVNLVRSQIGRNWMAIRDMDTAAAVIGIPVDGYKRLAFAVSSFYLGVAGALWAFAYLGTASAGSFDINRSFQILFIIIIGGMGSIAGNFVGAAFISLLPLLLNQIGQGLLGGNVDAGQLQNLQKIIFGVLIIWFLVKEPEGLIRLLANLGERLKAWPLRF